MLSIRRSPLKFLAAYLGFLFGAAAGLAAAPSSSIVGDLANRSLDRSEPVVADTIVSILVPRPEEDIQADILAAREATLNASTERALAELARVDAKTRIDIAKNRIDYLDNEKKRVEDLRNRSTDEAVRADYQNQRDDLERQKEMQDRRKRLFEAAEEVAKARLELAQAIERQAQADTEFYRRELQLGLAPETALPEVERRVLEAWKTAAERGEDVAGRRKQVIERQLTVLERAKDIRDKG